MVNPWILVRPLQADDEVAWHRLWAGYLDFYGATVPSEANGAVQGLRAPRDR